MTKIFHSLSKLFKREPNFVDAYEVVKDKSFLIIAYPSITAYVRDLQPGELEDA